MISRSFASFLNLKPQPTRDALGGDPARSIMTPSASTEPAKEAGAPMDKGKGKGRASPPPNPQHPENPSTTIGLSSPMIDPNFSFGLPVEEGSASHYSKGELVFCKSQVFVHPSKKRDDNIPGYLGLASMKTETPESEHAPAPMVLFWVPASVVEGLDEEDRYQKVSERADRILKSQTHTSLDSPVEPAQVVPEDFEEEYEGKPVFFDQRECSQYSSS